MFHSQAKRFAGGSVEKMRREDNEEMMEM